MNIQSIFAKVIHGAITLWDDAVTAIDNEVGVVKSVIPANAQATLSADLADVKQAVSNGLGLAATGVGDAEKALAAATEAALNAYLTAKTGGAAIPLVPIVDQGINGIGSFMSDLVQSWLLSAKAAVATNAPAPAAAPAALPHPAQAA